ncbi:hypothetical protein H0H92_015526 [Tricholoma furcatifolium]|nr:hypothetical protein H0H92_015526 [Tricholoma furcatifolium]
MSADPSTILLTLGVSVLILLLARFGARRTSLKLPPGPRGLPFLGNVLQVPGTHLATYFRHLLDQYGGFVSLNLAGFPIILIGDIKLAKAILDKHSAKHSSRPVVPYIRYHVDPAQNYWGALEDGEKHSTARKLSAGVMSAVRAGKTEQLQEFEALLNVQNLLDDGGKDWYHHMERVAGSSILAAAFGKHCPTWDEPDLKAVVYSIAELNALLAPAASIINVFPFLDLIPGPMPWRARPKAFREHDNQIYNKLIDDAVVGQASGMNTRVLIRQAARGIFFVKEYSLLTFQTAISLQTFVLACIRYPQWIAVAQKEIDTIVGADRLPSFKDRSSLPYIDAVVRETLRWRPSVRFGVPHQTTEDDVIQYQGQDYFIPKGSAIFAVPWAIEHDQSRYQDHDQFLPERFLDVDGHLKEDYETSAFGFGRRICPGSPFAERSIWIGVATMLWAFNIRASDELDPSTGLPFHYDDSDTAFCGDLTNIPFKFPAVFEPRSSQRAEISRREWAECEKDLNALLPLPKEI